MPADMSKKNDNSGAEQQPQQPQMGASQGGSPMNQMAGMGGMPNMFEDMAYAKFLQTAPELSNLIMVFKNCSEEMPEETDIQVGIFILRAGDDLIYVPVVSKGEGVYPIDSVFINSKNKFFPLTKNTTERIINSQKLSMGSPKKIPDTVPSNPSVYHLVNPPRTGKFVYASASRMTEFLASMPEALKAQVLEKFASDSNVYNTLHRLFDFKNIIGALKARSLETATQPKDRSIGVRVVTGGDDLPTPQVASILTSGYAIDGENPITRIAIVSEWWKDKRFTGLSSLEAGYDYDVILSNGGMRQAFVPVQKTVISKVVDYNKKPYATPPSDGYSAPQFMIFDNGDYAVKSSAVIMGECKEGHGVLRRLVNFRPPIVLKNVSRDDRIAIFDGSFCLVGVYDVRAISQTFNGCEIKAWDILNGSDTVIQGVRGYSRQAVGTDKEIFVSTTAPVIVLGVQEHALEDSVWAASRRREMLDWAMLSTSLNLSHDGVEFSINGSPIGKEAQVMDRLVVKEGIDPVVAEKFVKQATEKKHLTIYLSKQAEDFAPGEIPQFGNTPPRQINTLGKGQDYLPDYNLKAGLATGDAQTIESVVLSELLQAPDLKEHVLEYLPDIEEAIDKLGRILFLARLHINRLSDGFEADQVFEMLSSLKTVYAQLGNNFIKLENLANTMGEAKPGK